MYFFNFEEINNNHHICSILDESLRNELFDYISSSNFKELEHVISNILLKMDQIEHMQHFMGELFKYSCLNENIYKSLNNVCLYVNEELQKKTNKFN